MTAQSPLRVLALAPYPETAPSTRYRLVQLVPALAELGVGVDVHPFFSAEAYRRVVSGGGLAAFHEAVGAFESVRSVLARAGAYDAVLIQRGIGLLLDRSLLDTLRRQGVPLVYDFDDAVFLPQSRGRRWLEALRAPESTTAAFCRSAARVVAGNAYLADFARAARGGEAGVHVVPTVVDTDRFRPAPGRSGQDPDAETACLPVLGWVGSDSTVAYLETLLPALRSLAEKVPHRLVVVAGERRPHLPGVDFEHVRWTAESEAAVVRRLDVGLYPLDDTAWSRGKCGFKAIQYLASGVPCVASAVGVLRDIVRPEETGLHAGTPDEWVSACGRLLADPELRVAMGERGRSLVESRFSVRYAAPLLARALREAAAAGKAA